MCAFDLLAVVAGNLLLEKGSPSSSDAFADKDHCLVVNNTVKNEWQDEEKNMKVEAHDQGNPARSFFVSELVSQGNDQNCSSKELLFAQNEHNLGLASTLAASECAERFDPKLDSKSKNEIGTFASKVEVDSSGYREFNDCKLEGSTKDLIKDESNKSGKVQIGTMANICCFEDPVDWDGKPHALASSDSSAKVPLWGNNISRSSYPTNGDSINVDNRDDDENSSGCTHPSNKKKLFRPAPHIGGRRIRKILASKYWKVAPRLKDVTISNAGKCMIYDLNWCFYVSCCLYMPSH